MIKTYTIKYFYMRCSTILCNERYEPDSMTSEDELIYCIKESDWTNPSDDPDEGEWFCPECSKKLEEEKE